MYNDSISFVMWKVIALVSSFQRLELCGYFVARVNVSAIVGYVELLLLEVAVPLVDAPLVGALTSFSMLYSMGW